MTKPTTCCGRADSCICATEAKCSCGKQTAMNCNCEKKATENTLAGPRCSCSMTLSIFASYNADADPSGARPAGECTCDRAQTENQKPMGATCGCGKRADGRYECYNLSRNLLTWLPLQGSCTCEKAPDGGLLPEEIDFTTKA